MSDWNEKLITEFRANRGDVSAVFPDGPPLLLLHHIGARTGTARINPLAYQDLGDDSWAIFASKAGAPDNPDWFHNVRANPDVHIELGRDSRPVTARVAEGAERDQIWEQQKLDRPTFADYERKTERVIPVVVLKPRTT